MVWSGPIRKRVMCIGIGVRAGRRRVSGGGPSSTPHVSIVVVVVVVGVGSYGPRRLRLECLHQLLRPCFQRTFDPADHIHLLALPVLLQKGVVLPGRVRGDGGRSVVCATHQKLLVACPAFRGLDQALRDPVARLWAVGVFGEPWGIAVHDGGQLGKHVRVGLGRVWVLAEADLDHGEPEGPDVGGDGISAEVVLRFALDAFRLCVGVRE